MIDRRVLLGLAAGAVLFVIGLLVDQFGSKWINVIMPPTFWVVR